MARAASGSLTWDESRKLWRGRVTLLDGARPWFDIPGFPHNERGEKLARELVTERAQVARAEKLTAADFEIAARRKPDVAPSPRETVSEWYGRFYDWRESRGRGAESVEDSRGRFSKWIEPRLGDLAMSKVTRDDLERFAEYLDEQAAEEVIAPKTACNIWGEITVGFSFACTGHNKNGKNLALRVLEFDPSEGAAGPDSGTGKTKPFLRPDEVVKLLSCELIPLERRQVYACATYTAMRQAELRGLRVRDVSLDAMQITIVRQLKNGKEKERTKSGRARIVQIEPNLVPLLEALTKDRSDDDLLLHVGAHNRCAAHLRDDLILAGCTREALHVAKNDPMRARMKFHNLRDTCGTHMSVRRDPPQDIQWRLGHSTPAMTEQYITNARYQAGANFGTPLPLLPACLLRKPDAAPDDDPNGAPESSPESSAPSESTTVRMDTSHVVAIDDSRNSSIPAHMVAPESLRFPAPPPKLPKCSRRLARVSRSRAPGLAALRARSVEYVALTFVSVFVRAHRLALIANTKQ